MNKQSNIYTLLYIIALVLLVGTALAITTLSLRDRQQENVKADKMRQILASVHVTAPEDSILYTFDHLIAKQLMVNVDGTSTTGDAFAVDMASNAKLPSDTRQLPLFVCTLPNGDVKYIVPAYGAGLWGPIWGYIAVDADGTTIYGAYFAHQGETPGLGAEIEKPKFADQFIDKHIVHDSLFAPIEVVKKGQHPADAAAEYVDAISGGTITSKGVSAMLANCLQPYKNFFLNLSH